MVGYGADPNDVVALVRDHVSTAVLGNHDLAALKPGAEMGMNDWARAAAVWTRERVGEDEISYLSGLDLVAGSRGALFVHASPDSPDAWSYVLTQDDASRAFSSFSEMVCFLGHSHVPGFFEETDEGVRSVDGDTLHLVDGRRFLVNVGSVGQPRDGDRRASFALYEPDDRLVRIVRVDYDVDAARDKIISAGLPRELGDRLLDGH